jgi:hypothetical protein
VSMAGPGGKALLEAWPPPTASAPAASSQSAKRQAKAAPAGSKPSKGDKFRAMVAQNVRKDYHSTSSQCGEALHSDPWRAALRQRVGRGLRR